MSIEDIIKDAVVAWPTRDVMIIDEENRVSAIMNPDSNEFLLMQSELGKRPVLENGIKVLRK